MGSPGQQLGRNDRHVLRGRLRMSADAPRYRLMSSVEEALHLCSLPGENEGRAYYFRRLHVRGLPEDGERRTWLDTFQCALVDLVRRAVHGNDRAAGAADAVFFLNEQEACESLLALVLRRRPVDAWYWPAVSGTPEGGDRPTCAVALLEKLLRSPASWVAVASAVSSAMDPDNPLALLGLLSDAGVREWLRELDGEDAWTREVAPIRFAEPMRTALERATRMLGGEDPRVVWLASLAVILACPSEVERGAVVRRARLSLEAAGLANPSTSGSYGAEQDSRIRLRAGSPHTAIADLDRRPAQNGNSNPDRGYSRSSAAATPESPNGTTVQPFTTANPIVETGTTVSALVQHNGDFQADHFLGEPTAGAGLYFLLNALRYLKRTDEQFSLRFLAQFFQRIARHAGVESDDAILRWTHVTMENVEAGEIDERALRIWMLKVRRWCWRNGRISVRDVVRRPGVVSLTRADLDVSLALESADIRIRRIGLDIDPGWLPWFGRVVRFHYLYRGEFHA